jgi:hypothetical protein
MSRSKLFENGLEISEKKKYHVAHSIPDVTHRKKKVPHVGGTICRFFRYFICDVPEDPVLRTGVQIRDLKKKPCQTELVNSVSRGKRIFFRVVDFLPISKKEVFRYHKNQIT